MIMLSEQDLEIIRRIRWASRSWENIVEMAVLWNSGYSTGKIAEIFDTTQRAVALQLGSLRRNGVKGLRYGAASTEIMSAEPMSERQLAGLRLANARSDPHVMPSVLRRMEREYREMVAA